MIVIHIVNNCKKVSNTIKINYLNKKKPAEIIESAGLFCIYMVRSTDFFFYFLRTGNFIDSCLMSSTFKSSC